MMPNLAAFFDRDGVVNVSPGAGYVLSWEEFEFSPGLVEVLREVKNRGYLTILVTSQRCVGKGLISREGLEEIHRKMQEELSKDEVGFDAIYVFSGEPGTEGWEKPKPGMVHAAAKAHDLALADSFLVGDADRDIEMARNAGVGTSIRVRGDKEIGVDADHEVGDLTELHHFLRELLC